jgi:RecA/RadA recombinase
MDLMSAFRSKISKIKDPGINKTAEFDVMYSTGFLSIDYLNGTTVHVESKNRSFTYNSTGIVDGSTVTIIGRSGSGKSTLETQIAGNIIKPFIKKGMPTGLYIDDIEGSLPWVRKEFLLGLTPEEFNNFVDIRNTGITSQNVYQRIQSLHDIKVQNRKDFEYDTGLFDTSGNRIFKLVPTVYMIDSLPMLLPEDLADDDELGGRMDASSIAKTNTMMFKKISQLCKEANIILFTVNHILDDIQIGFIPKAGQISGLKQGERLPGGKAAIYLANNMFRVDDSLTLKASEGFGIDGSVVTLTLIKSRTNATKRSVPLIFNKSEGKFDSELSMFQLLKNEGAFSGAGAYLYLDECPDIKFGQKNFKEVLNSSPEFQRAFAKLIFVTLSKFLSDTRAVQESNENSASENIMNMISEMSMSNLD